MSTVDRTAEPDAVFDERLASWESADEVDVAADVAEDAAVERVARALHAHEYNEHEYPWDDNDDFEKAAYRRLARAAVAAMPPADEARWAGMQAVREMPHDWYCPRSEPGRRRRDCPECVAEVALDAALDGAR